MFKVSGFLPEVGFLLGRDVVEARNHSNFLNALLRQQWVSRVLAIVLLARLGNLRFSGTTPRNKVRKFLQLRHLEFHALGVMRLDISA